MECHIEKSKRKTVFLVRSLEGVSISCKHHIIKTKFRFVGQNVF